MTDVAEAIGSIKFTSIAGTGTQFRALNLEVSQFADSMTAALGASPTKALTLAKGIVATATDKAAFASEGEALFAWGKASGTSERQTLTAAYRQALGHAGKLFVMQ
jgi:hypothetical protein